MRPVIAMAVAVLLSAAGAAEATIVLPQDGLIAAGVPAYVGASNGYIFRSGGGRTNSFAYYDISPPRSNAAYLAQRSRTWAQYRNSGDPYRRFGMVYTPAAGSMMMGISDRQALVREHISRASAYRLRYFDK